MIYLSVQSETNVIDYLSWSFAGFEWTLVPAVTSKVEKKKRKDWIVHIYFDDLKLFVLFFVCFFADFRRVTDVSLILFFETEINAKFQNFCILFWIIPLFYRFENQNERPTQIQKPNV